MRPLKIFGWAKDHNGCGNYRLGLPMWALARAGHEARAFSLLNVDIPDDLDVMVGQIIADEAPTEAWQALAALPNRSFALIYEIDDDVWNLQLSVPEHRHFMGETGERVKRNIAVSDAVTVTTEYLADQVRPHNPNVFVLPNCFDASILSYERPHSDELTVGWAGGSSHQHDFLAVSKDLVSFFKRNPQVVTHFIGVNHGAAIGRPAGRFTPWRTNLVDYIHGVDFDIGIAPLACHAFNRSKSDLKYLEYASLGIPVVASDFGPYAESIIHGVTGLKVKYPHEWARHLRALAVDEQLRIELGRNAKSWATTRTIQANTWRWEEAYYSVLGIPHALDGEGLSEQSDPSGSAGVPLPAGEAVTPVDSGLAAAGG
jgi:glycosyltransferase involved in cell wall biosynthesis